MPIKTVVSSNVVPFASLLILLVFVIVNPVFDRKQSKLFAVAIGINLLLLAAISADYLFAYMGQAQGVYIWRRITSFLNFAASPVIPLLLLFIFDKNKTKKWLYYLPVLINLAICFASIFAKIVFYISPTNKYGRGDLFFLPFLTTIFYVVILMASRSTSHIQSKRTERIYLFAVILLLFSGMAMEIIGGYFFITWGFTAISLVGYYLLLSINSVIIDSLTGVYNRRMYNKALGNMKDRYPCIVASVDINQFKRVNDEYGHDAGDRCLILFTEILVRAFSGIANVYRIGGDEFILISKRADIEKFASAVERARQTMLQRIHVSFACGVLEYRPGDDQEELLKKIDALMYQNKRENPHPDVFPTREELQ